MAADYSNIPDELRQLPQWVIADVTKRPFSPKTGHPASVTDPSTWGTHEEAVAARDDSRTHVGLVLTREDPYAVIDLDDKPDRPINQATRDLHQRVISAFDSYTERSAGGRGFHIIVKGTLPSSVHDAAAGIEAYSSARYMICTGDVVKAVPIAERQEGLVWLHDFTTADAAPDGQPVPDHEEVESDASVVERAMSSTSGEKFTMLCNGRWEDDYPSQSEADLALLSFLCANSPSNVQVRRLFRSSSLGKRDKATKNDVYLDRSIRRIRLPVTGVEDQATTTRPLEAKVLSIEEVLRPPPEGFICGGLFPLAKPSVFFAPQGAGKSAFLSQLAFAFGGHAGLMATFLGLPMVKGGPALIYSAEDTLDDWKGKACAYQEVFGREALERALPNVHVYCNDRGFGSLTEIVQIRSGPKDRSIVRHEQQTTPEWARIRDYALKIGAKLIIIETTSRMVAKEDNETLAAYIGALGNLASETGAAVITSHHPNKSASKENDPSAESARGGGSFVNNSRCAVTLFPARKVPEQWKGLFAQEDVLTLEHVKSTSRRRKQPSITLFRLETSEGGVLVTEEELARRQVPHHADLLAARASAQHRDELRLLQSLWDVVNDESQLQRVSPYKIDMNFRDRIKHQDGKPLTRAEVGPLIRQALQEGVLVAVEKDALGKTLSLQAGVRPGASARTQDG